MPRIHARMEARASGSAVISIVNAELALQADIVRTVRIIPRSDEIFKKRK